MGLTREAQIVHHVVNSSWSTTPLIMFPILSDFQVFCLNSQMFDSSPYPFLSFHVISPSFVGCLLFLPCDLAHRSQTLESPEPRKRPESGSKVTSGVGPPHLTTLFDSLGDRPSWPHIARYSILWLRYPISHDMKRLKSIAAGPLRRRSPPEPLLSQSFGPFSCFGALGSQ